MEYKRLCPNCKKEVFYSRLSALNLATKENRLCRSCSKSGKNNSFYGKHHTEKSKKKYRKSREKGYKNSKYVSKEFKEKMRKLSITGNHYGESNYDIWLKKFGKDIADEKLKNFCHKISKKTSGKNNPMYGKPSPQGSGNGWSGWYNNWFFRSLKELSYMIKVIERFNLEWESTEKKEFRIQYNDWEGKERNYFPDFLINKKYIVEIKPKKLWNTPLIKAKKEAAKKWCKEKGYKYKIIEPKLLTEEEIKNLYQNKQIKFLEKYETKFREKYEIKQS